MNAFGWLENYAEELDALLELVHEERGVHRYQRAIAEALVPLMLRRIRQAHWNIGEGSPEVLEGWNRLLLFLSRAQAMENGEQAIPRFLYSDAANRLAEMVDAFFLLLQPFHAIHFMQRELWSCCVVPKLLQLLFHALNQERTGTGAMSAERTHFVEGLMDEY